MLTAAEALELTPVNKVFEEAMARIEKQIRSAAVEGRTYATIKLTTEENTACFRQISDTLERGGYRVDCTSINAAAFYGPAPRQIDIYWAPKEGINNGRRL